MVARSEFLNECQKFPTFFKWNANEAAKDMDLPSNPNNSVAKFTLLPTDRQAKQETQDRNGGC